ncbi:hypothetical protein Y032_0070g438 [Ancylostoma ceylanicum]|uniref:Uncharacterized protein n=1 Tax=Ancylostoma ceylanicum TaxID=53326 RepID=A0A016TWM3_9BILA|nr:hypothetical protein Y032_0070g438 [Ancylostoma ceylanicum]
MMGFANVFWNILCRVATAQWCKRVSPTCLVTRHAFVSCRDKLVLTKHRSGKDYYFNFHHSEADYVSIFEEDDISYTAGIFAVLAHNIANMDDW